MQITTGVINWEVRLLGGFAILFVLFGGKGFSDVGLLRMCFGE